MCFQYGLLHHVCLARGVFSGQQQQQNTTIAAFNIAVICAVGDFAAGYLLIKIQ
jgi:hypothetical protein